MSSTGGEGAVLCSQEGDDDHSYFMELLMGPWDCPRSFAHVYSSISHFSSAM